jgi:hypothetical protein
MARHIEAPSIVIGSSDTSSRAGAHGPYGVEAQFLDSVELRISRTFRQELDSTRTPRQMAIAWAEEWRKAIEKRDD